MEVIEKGAVLSSCKTYRYQLWRIWDDTKPKVMFLMLNPSTADANEDDATIRKCTRYAARWGYGGFYVGNLYGFRSKDRSVLKSVLNPIGKDNEMNLLELSKKCDKIVCAWGNEEGRPERIFSKFKNLHYLKINKDKENSPSHPLYLNGDLIPVKF
jgi:hypothetical protein